MGGATRGGTAEPNSRDQNRRQERGQGKGKHRKSYKEEKIIGMETEAARQSRAAPPATKQSEQSSTCTWTGDHSSHAQRPDDGGGWDARSWTGARCSECVRATGVRRHRFTGDPPHRSGHSVFSQAGYSVYCSGECGGENGRKQGQGGVGLVVRTSITRAARTPEFISDRLLKVTLELHGCAKGVTFFVAYGRTETQNANNKHAFWTSLDKAKKEVPTHEQLFVLVDANARTGRRGKGQVRSKDSKILGVYGRNILNDNGELLLSFANNYDLALVNTFFSTPKGSVSHRFNGRGKKHIDYILTRQRGCKLVLNVMVHPQPSFLPISDHNVVSAAVKLLGYFAQNRRLRAPAKPQVDRRRLVTDPQLRQEVTTAVGRQLRGNLTGDSSVDDAEAAFTVAIMWTAELVIPLQERRRTGRGWSGDARTEAELQATTGAMNAAGQRLKMDTRDAQLRSTVRKACNWLKKVRSAAVVRFFERHVVELEKQLRVGDHHGFFQNIKSVQLEETKKVESRCIRDEEGRLLRDKGRIYER